MAGVTKAQFVGTHTIAETEVDAVVKAGGSRAFVGLENIWQYGQTDSTLPVEIGKVAQAYVIPDTAAVDAFLRDMGPYGHRMMGVIIGTAGGPTISVQPANDSVTAPAAGSFSVTASGTGTLTYQWYEVGVGALTGETASTYNTGATVSPDDNGRQFYVEVTDDNGVTVSSTATLTVA